MPKRKSSSTTVSTTKRTKISASAKRRAFNRRGQLAGDGSTWTLEMAVPRSRMALESSIFKTVQTVTSQAWISSSTSNPIFGSVSVSASQIDQIASFQTIFDQYRIDQVEVWLTPQISASVSNATGMLYTVIDYDDASNLTTLGQAQDYATCVTGPAKNGHFRRFVPHMAMAAYGGSLFNAYTNVRPQWIDMASPAVPHYGVKVALSTASAIYVYDLTIRLSVSFRCVR